MESTKTLIAGAGVSGLATAAALGSQDYLLVEADTEIGGFCKTVKREGFVWDYSGHFFHFRHPEIEAWLRERMAGQEIRTVQKRSLISYAGRQIDFPFQKNIHQLPLPEFIECLHDLYFAAEQKGEERNFKEMLYGRYGKAISEKFLIPYNEKLYATDLSTLDRDAMGRFFPQASVAEVIRHLKTPDNSSYNATFTYPRGGAVEYIRALASAVRSEAISTSEPLLEVDLEAKVARTSKRRIRFERLVSSLPLPRLLKVCGLPFEEEAFSWNKVLVFNLGFDRKGPEGVHWLYFPNRDRPFYRVGFYDNIFGEDRMSLYVELGFPRDAQVEVERWKGLVLEGLREEGILRDQQLLAEHSVVMDPAYVHITTQSNREVARVESLLAERGVFSIGRYGSWTYCSIEDNIVEARALVTSFSRGGRGAG